MVLLNNVVGVYAAIRLTAPLPPPDEWHLTKLVLCCLVGFPLFLSLALLKERRQYQTALACRRSRYFGAVCLVSDLFARPYEHTGRLAVCP